MPVILIQFPIVECEVIYILRSIIKRSTALTFRKNIINRINEIKDLQQRLSEGEVVQMSDDDRNDEFGAIKKSLKRIASGLV